jgi:hypothetical protein
MPANETVSKQRSPNPTSLGMRRRASTNSPPPEEEPIEHTVAEIARGEIARGEVALGEIDQSHIEVRVVTALGFA